jgi:putative transposase
MVKRPIELSATDRKYLAGLTDKGQLRSRVFKRSTGLLELDRGRSLAAVAPTLGVARITVAGWRDSYRQKGLKCLEDAPRPGRPIKIDGQQRAKITALACSPAPAGHARWNLRLLAGKVVELGYCGEISHTQVGHILKKTNSSRTSSGPGASGR